MSRIVKEELGSYKTMSWIVKERELGSYKTMSWIVKERELGR